VRKTASAAAAAAASTCSGDEFCRITCSCKQQTSHAKGGHARARRYDRINRLLAILAVNNVP
jgi:hypothetical protein